MTGVETKRLRMPPPAPLCETDTIDVAHPPPATPSSPTARTKGQTVVCETDDLRLATRTRIDRRSLDYVWKSGLAGGLAGCAAKTLIAPLDRVKILFQTSNPRFERYTTRRLGVWYAAVDIYKEFGVTGLFKGHAATLLRIFPYAGIKFVAYEQFRGLLIKGEQDEVPWRRFAAGSLAGLSSVFFTYPLEVIRVRMAFETRDRRVGFSRICREIYADGLGRSKSLANFYRGFTPTMAGMLPYAGVSFLTHDSIGDLLRDPRLAEYTTIQGDGRRQLVVWAELTAGGLAGMLSQTASYPLEVVRRRMQVSGAVGNGARHGFWQTVSTIWQGRGFRGFFVGLTIGYIKVIPMAACSFYTYERMKHVLGIV